MREPKFRQPIRDKEGKFLEWFYWGFIDGDFITPAIQSNGIDTRKESQMFTGLKDKNGKEWYEGEIIRAPHFPHNLVVGFNQESASFCASKNIDFETKNCYFFNNDIDLSDGWESIGNIYENPELLNP